MSTVLAIGRQPRLLAATGTRVAVTGTTAETVLATVAVPASLPVSNGWLRITSLWSCTSGASNKTCRLRYSGAAGTILMTQILTTTTGYVDVRHLVWSNGAALQKVQAGANAFGTVSALAAPNADSSVATTLAFTGQLASAADTAWLEGYAVEFFAAT